MINIGDNGSAALCDLLPPKNRVFECLEALQCCAQFWSFPHLSDEVTKEEIENFLTDPKNNAEKAPSMLGLIFASLALSIQLGVFHQSSQEWVSGVLQGSHNASECYRKPLDRSHTEDKV